MSQVSSKLTAERIRTFFLFILFISIPFSIAGGDFAISGLYLTSVYILIRKKQPWVRQKILYGILLLLLGAIIASLASADPLGGFLYFRSFWRFGLPFLVFLGLQKRDIDPFLRALLIVSFLMSIYGTIQFFTGIDFFRSLSLQQEYTSNGKTWHAVGAFSHHLTYGGVSLILFALFTPAVFDSSRIWRKRVLFAAGSLGNLLAVLFSLGRSIWLGAITAIGVMVLLRLRLKTLIVIILLLACGFAIYSQIDDNTKRDFYRRTAIGRRINSFTVKDNIDRILMWQAAFNMIKDRPILGFGPRNDQEKQPYYDALAEKENHKFQHPVSTGVHNIYLQTWIDFGLLGLLGYLTWWGIILVEILIAVKTAPQGQNGYNAFLKGLVAAFCGILVAGFFENNFRDGEVQTAILTAMGIALAMIWQKQNSPANT